MAKNKRWPTEILYVVLHSLKDRPGLHKTEIGFGAALSGYHVSRWLRYMERVQVVMVEDGYYHLTGKGAKVLTVLEQLFDQLGATDVDHENPDSTGPVSMTPRPASGGSPRP